LQAALTTLFPDQHGTATACEGIKKISLASPQAAERFGMYAEEEKSDDAPAGHCIPLCGRRSSSVSTT